MGRYIAKRIFQNIITFFLFLTAIYFLVDAQPGDYADIFLNDPRLTAEQRQILRHNMGLDKPVHERYLIWLKNFFQGDLGISFSNYPRPVLDVIAERAPRTIVLFLTANVVSFYMGFITGKVLAWRRGGLMEYITTLGGVGLYTVFTPWFALMMIWIFAFTLKLFPIGKFIDPVLWRDAPVSANFVFNRMLLTGLVASILLFVVSLVTRRMNPAARRTTRWIGTAIVFAAIIVFWMSLGAGIFALDILGHMILPILTVALISFAGTMLLTRSSMLETLREDYILTARAKGLPEKVVRDKHAARNALLPVVTALVFSLAFSLSGGVITETMFSWPGMGLTLLAAAQVSDIPMVIGSMVFIGILALSAHLVADILYAFLDPRIRYT